MPKSQYFCLSKMWQKFTSTVTYRDEELASIRSWSSVSHAEVIWFLVLDLKVFVGEFLTCSDWAVAISPSQDPW